jgi:hypothetical protein
MFKFIKSRISANRLAVLFILAVAAFAVCQAFGTPDFSAVGVHGAHSSALLLVPFAGVLPSKQRALSGSPASRHFWLPALTAAYPLTGTMFQGTQGALGLRATNMSQAGQMPNGEKLFVTEVNTLLLATNLVNVDLADLYNFMRSTYFKYKVGGGDYLWVMSLQELLGASVLIHVIPGLVADAVPSFLPSFTGSWKIKSRALDIAQGRAVQVDYEMTVPPPATLYTTELVEVGLEIRGYLAKDVEIGTN